MIVHRTRSQVVLACFAIAPLVLGAIPAAAAEPAAVKCGFMTISGLAIVPESGACVLSNRKGSGYTGLTSLDGANYTARLAPGDVSTGGASLEVKGERDTAGLSGFKHLTTQAIRDYAVQSGQQHEGRDYSGVIVTPFRHVAFTMDDGGPWACVVGQIESSDRVWGTLEVRAYAFVQYCERGVSVVSEASLHKIAGAINLD